METELIKKTIEEFLQNMGVSFEGIELISQSNLGKPTFVIKSKESGLLIGTEGVHYSALNHLLRKIVSKKIEGSEKNFFIDVNDYQARTIEIIKNKAQILAERARSFKASVEMEPMSSYERMIVHSYFENSADIKTESAGEGSGRKVVLKYIVSKSTESEKF
jgi:predicted RNA-binding protein Jag